MVVTHLTSSSSVTVWTIVMVAFIELYSFLITVICFPGVNLIENHTGVDCSVLTIFRETFQFTVDF